MNRSSFVPVSFAGDSRTRLISATSLQQLDWDEKNTLAILTQLNGSVWPRVWVYGIVNVLLTLSVYILRKHEIIDLTSRSVMGHRYMVMVMSFLVVTRVKVTYDRYMGDSAALQDCFRTCRELVNFVCHLTKDGSLGPQYRHDVAMQMLKLVGITVQVLDFRTKVYEGKVTEIPSTLQVFTDVEIMPNLSSIGRSPRTKKNQKKRVIKTSDLKIDAPELSTISSVQPLELLSEACRAPIYSGYDVAAAIMLDQRAKGTVWRHPCNEELRLLGILDEYLKAFHVLEMHMTTVRTATEIDKGSFSQLSRQPIPFPLVQMTKTFLFVWIFSLPFAMPVAQHDLLMSLVIVFLITYGFLGLEFVAMEMTDCFGDDPSDLDKFGGAEQCYEDCYLAIYKCDGIDWAMRLREGVEDFVEYSLFANTPSMNNHALI